MNLTEKKISAAKSIPSFFQFLNNYGSVGKFTYHPTQFRINILKLIFIIFWSLVIDIVLAASLQLSVQN